MMSICMACAVVQLSQLSCDVTVAQVKIGTDVAASEFYTAEKKHYDLDFKNPSSPADAGLH